LAAYTNLSIAKVQHFDANTTALTKKIVGDAANGYHQASKFLGVNFVASLKFH